MAYPPGNIDLTASRETGLPLGLPVVEDGEPVDLTGWLFDMTIGTRCDPDLLIISGVADVGGSTIAPDGTMIAIDITPETLATIGSPAAHQESYLHNIYATPPGGSRERLLAGDFMIRRD